MATNSRRDLDTSLENQLAAEFDDAGNMVGGKVTRSDADHLSFMRLLSEAAERFPLDESDIVYPAGQTITTETRDADGIVVARMMTVDYTQPQPNPYDDSSSPKRKRRRPAR